MSQEDQTQRCSNSSGGGFGASIGSISSRSLSKKPKQKKAPQRGLGVAQLEKIRLEEQQKKDAVAVPAASTLSSPSSKSSSYISLPIPNHPQSRHSSSISFPSISPADLSSSNSIFRPPLPVLNTDIRNSISVPLVNQASNCGSEILWPAIPVMGQGESPKLWSSCEFNLEKENSQVDPGLTFQPNLYLPFESNLTWAPTGLTQRARPYQQSSTALMNAPSATSSSSVLNFQIEPPSNQSYDCNYNTMWPEEEKTVGMKRPYPFYPDNPPGTSFNNKFLTSASLRSDDSSSYGNVRLLGIPVVREGNSCTTSTSEPNSKKSIAENTFNGDFLTLATPANNRTSTKSSNFNHPSAYRTLYNHELPDFESLPYQRGSEVPLFQPVSSSSSQNRPFYSFFPPAKTHIDQPTCTIKDKCDGEVGESVDLNLKL